jgi:hypothetical protein
MIMRLFALIWILFCCSFGQAEEAVEISLSEIWAYNIPGTKKVKELEPNLKHDVPVHELVANSSNYFIQRKLSRMRKDIPPCFVVEGDGEDALLAARDVFSDMTKRKDTFTSDKKLTLVFFAGSRSHGINLKPIKILGDQIEIRYELFRPKISNLTVNPQYGLIPLGKLQARKYEVVVSPVEPDIVSGSTIFEVKEARE